MKRRITLEKLNADLDRMIENARQFIRDVEWWNTHRTDAEPMDSEDMKVLLSLALKARAEPDTRKRAPMLAAMVASATAGVNERDERGVLRD